MEIAIGFRREACMHGAVEFPALPVLRHNRANEVRGSLLRIGHAETSFSCVFDQEASRPRVRPVRYGDRAIQRQGQKAYFSPTLSAQYWVSLNVRVLSNGVVPSARTGL